VRYYSGYPRYVPRTSLYYSNTYYYSPYYVPTIRIYNTMTPPPVVVNRVEVARPPAQVVVEEVPVDVPLEVKLIDTALREGAEDRRAAARSLSQYPKISSVAVLVDVLINDADAAVRSAAAKSLGEIGDPAGYEALLRSAAFELDEEVRVAAEAAAATIKAQVEEEELYVSPKMPPMNTGDEKLGQYLEELRFGNAEIRKEAANKMEGYPGTQTVTALVDMLINDAADEVREEAAESLGALGDRMALPFLKWAQLNDPNESVREDAEKAIEKIYEKIL